MSGLTSLQVYADGITDLTAEGANAFEQTCDNVTYLRGFIGQTGMNVSIRGTSTPGDGGFAIYYWNATSTAADNGTTVLRPFGIAVTAAGRWLQLLATVNQSTVTPTGTTTARSIADLFGDWCTVKDFGAKGDGTTDDTAAIQRAFNAGCGNFPEGGYKISATLFIPIGLHINGQGRQSSVIFTNTPNLTLLEAAFVGPSPTFADIDISYIGLSAGAGATAGVTGVSATLAIGIHVHDVTFSGCAAAVIFDRTWFGEVRDCLSQSTSLLPAGGCFLTDSTESSSVNWSKVVNFDILNLGAGTSVFGVYLHRAQNCVISATMNDLTTGNASPAAAIIIENNCSFIVIDWLEAILPSNGILLRQGSTGPVATPSYVTIQAAQIIAPSAAGIFASGSFLNITGSVINANGSFLTAAGIVLSNVANGTVTDCQIAGFSGAAGTAIQLSNVATGVISGNSISDCDDGVGFVGGITNVLVDSNQFTTVANPIANSFAAMGNLVTGSNGGITLSSYASTPGFPATTVGLTNTTGFDQRITFSGAGITQVKINGIVIPTGITGTVLLRVGEVITFAYTGSPTWAWIPG